MAYNTNLMHHMNWGPASLLVNEQSRPRCQPPRQTNHRNRRANVATDTASTMITPTNTCLT